VIAERLAAIRARIEAACASAGRDPKTVTLVAVSKGHPASAIREAAAAGASDFGENYAQEFAGKRGDAGDVRWHFIGRLQRNKAKLVAGQVELIHAVDSLELAQELGKRAGRVQPILLSVNVAGEASKGGLTAAAVPELAAQLADVANIRLDGLMTMPPPDVDPRPFFEQLRALAEQLKLPVLSMGMSDDFEIAIACGATHVRVGTAIFGPRPVAPE